MYLQYHFRLFGLYLSALWSNFNFLALGYLVHKRIPQKFNLIYVYVKTRTDNLQSHELKNKILCEICTDKTIVDSNLLEYLLLSFKTEF